MEEISFDLVGKRLEEDIVSELNVLLLKKGSILTETNILLLKKHNYQTVKVSEDQSFLALYKKNIPLVKELFSTIELNNIDIKEWFDQDNKIVRWVQKNSLFFEEMYEFQAENSLSRHSVNVGLLSFYLGKLLRYSYQNKLLLWQMGILHDVGKVKLDPDLLLKRHEDVSVEDQQQYRKHTELGWEFLKEQKNVNVLLLNAARHHHETIDGSGFPKGINVKYIPIMVQIVTVANTIDHSYSKNRNVFELISILIEQTKENKLNPAIVNPFVRHLLRKYVGKKVRLNDETTAELMFIFDNEPSQPLIYHLETETFIDLRKYEHLKIVHLA